MKTQGRSSRFGRGEPAGEALSRRPVNQLHEGKVVDVQAAGRRDLPCEEVRLMRFTRITVDPRQMGDGPCIATGISYLSSPF
jgi:hypothetical protein